MRITGGKWRGRRLGPVPGGRIRPTTDRVREALFNILRDEIDGRVVIDGCCGSGALGIEALSRGAAHVDFVDLTPAALRTVQENLDRCGAEPGSYRLHRADLPRWLERGLTAADAPPVVLVDPPYGGPVIAALLAVIDAEPAPALLVLEHASDDPLPTLAADRWTSQTRRYGNSALTLIRPVAPEIQEQNHG